MASDNDITINADGTITRRNALDDNGGSSDNTGCVWIIIIAVCVIVGIIIAANSDDNDNTFSEPDEVVSEVANNDDDNIAENVYEVIASNEATYLSVSESDVTFDSDGGYIDIEINTDGDWEIGTQPYEWGHITKYSSSIRLRVESYSGEDDRTDWFTIKAGDYEERINITQRAEWTNCSSCGGSGYTSCSYCSNGYRRCSNCNDGYTTCTNSDYTGVVDNIGQFGHGRNVPVYTYDPWTGMQMIAGYRLEVCPTCGGSYRVKCSYCDGSGRTECIYCDGEGERECSWCDGYGKIRN